MATLALGNGQPDSYFIAEVRRIFRDQPIGVQESPASDGSAAALGVATSKPLKLQRPPIIRQNAVMTAQAAANMPGFAAYRLLFDPPPPTFNPTTRPVISDGGVGTWASGTYQFTYTYVTAAGEVGMSPISLPPGLTIAVNRAITVAAITGLPTAVTSLNVYCTQSSAGGSSVGLVGSMAVAAGTAATTTFSAPPVGVGFGIVPALLFSDTGELFFPAPPSTGSISAQYQTSRYGDQQVLDALYEGLGMLWPEIWSYQPVDTVSVLPSPIQYEYTLPATYAALRAVITEVEQRPPSAFIIFRRISGWRFLDDPVAPLLIFTKPPPVGGVVRIRYVVPFVQLADVPSLSATGQILPPANLPIYYAVSRLLADAEIMRSRADDLPSLTAENAGSEKGGNLQTAGFWMQNMFAPELRKLSIGPPMRRSVMDRVAERLGLSRIWQDAA